MLRSLLSITRRYLKNFYCNPHLHADEMLAGFCTGQLRYKLEYSKRTKKWVVKPIADHKRYGYLLDLMQDVIKLRLHGRDTTDILIEDPIAKDFPRNMLYIQRPKL